MVDIFKTIEELVEFEEASNTQIPGGEVANISYPLILIQEEWKNPMNSGKTYKFA